MTHEEEQQIARDSALIDLVMVFGTPAKKRQAARQKKIIYAAIHQQNVIDGLDCITDEELLTELMA